jgi:hypothetical protein
VPVHERLGEQAPGSLGRVERFLDLTRVAAEGLLDEDVLPGLDGLDRPLHVHGVRERDVDGVDVGVRKERLVRAVGPLDLPLAGVGLRAALVAARDRDDLHLVGLAGRRDHESVDVGSRDDAEADLLQRQASFARRRAGYSARKRA